MRHLVAATLAAVLVAALGPAPAASGHRAWTLPGTAPVTVPRTDASRTDGIQEALDAGGEVRLTPGETYVLDATVRVPRGLTRIDGQGARLVVRPGVGVAVQLVSSASGLVLHDLAIDLSQAPQAKGIAASAMANRDAGYPDEVMRDVTIERVTLTGLGPTAKGIEVVARDGHAERLTIRDNLIVFAGDAAQPPAEGAVGISVVTTPPLGGAGQWDSYTRHDRIVAGTHHAHGFVVSGNRVHGGYYGIGFEGVTGAQVTGNRLAWNTRNISLQAGSSDNLVAGNHLTDAVSAAIHVAYQSHRNTVRDNLVATRRASGEGLLQAYTGSQDTWFVGNHVHAVHPDPDRGPMWALHASTGADRTRFEANVVSAPVRRTLLASESIWDGESVTNGTGKKTSPYSYMTDAEKPTPRTGVPAHYHGGRGPLTQVTYVGNVLHNPTDRPLVYVGAEVTTVHGAAVGDVRDVTVQGNAVIASAAGGRPEYHEGGYGGVGPAHVDRSGVTLPQPQASFVRAGHVWAPTDRALAPGQTHLWLLGTATRGTGTDADDHLYGNPAANALTGGAGADTLTGGLGPDTLTGGPGPDRFVLEPPLQPTSVTEADDLTDLAADDRILLARVHVGSLTGAWFTPDGATPGPETRIHQDGRSLWFDADGPAAPLSPVLMATVPAGTHLTQASFDLV